MSNYFWTIDGRYKQINTIEHLTDGSSHFHVLDDSICIDDMCLDKNEISQLKELLPSFNIIERSSSLDTLTFYECKLLLKNIFISLLDASNDNEKINIFNNYFIYGLHDPKSGDKLSFNSFYLDNVSNFIDFQDIYLNIDSLDFNMVAMTESMIQNILESSKVQVTDRLIFCLSLADIKNVSINLYSTTFKEYTIQLIKITNNSESKWRIILLTNNLIEAMYIKQDENFNLKFNNELDVINILNQRNDISLTEFRNYVDNLRGVSLSDGIFDLQLFKNNIFIDYYKVSIDLSALTDDIIMQKIYNPDTFDKIEIINLEDEKIFLGYYELFNYYILLENSDDLELKLFYGKKNSTDIYKWMLLYLEK